MLNIKIRSIQCGNLPCSSYETPKFEPPELSETKAAMQSMSSNPVFFLLGFCRNIISLKRVHALLILTGLIRDPLSSSKLVSSYGSFGHVHYARLMFDQIPNPDFCTLKVMLRCYFLNDLYYEVLDFHKRIRMCFKENDNVVWSVVLKACCELRDINEGRKLHCQVEKMGGPDSFVLTGLVDLYAKCGFIGYSRVLFDEILDNNVVSWTSMIVGYVQNDCAEEGLILYNRMRKGLLEGNEFTIGSVVTACTKLGALHQGKYFHGYVIKNGYKLNSILGTSILDMYVKCGDIRYACSVFNELSSVDLVSWTAMIAGYSQVGSADEALKLFIDKNGVEFLPNSITIANVLSSCAKKGNLNLGRSVHGLGIKLCLEDSIVRNALVDMYAKCHLTSDAQCVFERIMEKDVISWNSMISGYSRNGRAYEAFQLLHQMRSQSFSPDAITIVSVLSSCISLGALHVGSSLHALSLKEGLLTSNIIVGTAFLNLYAKCGDAQSARMIFDGMGEKNIITWSAMMGGYGLNGVSWRSLGLFSEMLKEDMKPNEVIFTTILSACSHAGMVEEGWRYFNSMHLEYKFMPSMKHYVCMVDLLARAGLLDEALAFIEKMPVVPDVSLFGAFLHGCELYSRFDLGETAIRKMLELGPDKASYYVLMYNLYRLNGRWGQVDQLKELMKHRGFRKSLGCSMVETNIINAMSPVKMACVG